MARDAGRQAAGVGHLGGRIAGKRRARARVSFATAAAHAAAPRGGVAGAGVVGWLVVRVLFTRLSDRTHRFEVTRGDGSSENAVLETRSYLVHDLTHYAVEAEVPIEDGFYGLLDRGTPLERLNDRTQIEPLSPGLAVAESLVGPMQSLFGGRLDPALFREQCEQRFPGLVAMGFVERAVARLRRLAGHWAATPFHGAMELEWPAVPVGGRAHA